MGTRQAPTAQAYMQTIHFNMLKYVFNGKEYKNDKTEDKKCWIIS